MSSCLGDHNTFEAGDQKWMFLHGGLRDGCRNEWVFTKMGRSTASQMDSTMNIKQRNSQIPPWKTLKNPLFA